ncbi:hypothetical protein EV424DRAFT_1351304 [Suillus variegatus]|nr:hypothetical protein EV424DRAFT_1351304 [Suillus variegatus]
MDYYVYHGFTVLDFDHFFGEPIHDCMDKPGFDRPMWIERAFSNTNTHTRPWADAVVKKYGSGMKYCAVGFCFGGPQVFNLAKEGSLIICDAIADPATLSEDLTEIDECTCPFPKETRRKVENRLVEQKKTCHFHISSGRVKEDCQRGMVAWFKRFTT